MIQETPNEKASILVLTYLSIIGHKLEEAKQCAIVVVSEMIAEHMFDYSEYSNRRHIYWKEVKQEINNL